MKGNIIRLNTLHLNSVSMNGVKVQGSSASGGGGIVPIPPVEPLPTYILSASVANGVVTATRNGVVVTLPLTANEGDTIVLSVQPNEGYEFNGWDDGNTDNPRSVTMVSDVVLSAECSEVGDKKKAEFEVDSETMNLLADGDEDDEELSSLSFAIDSETMSLIMSNGGKVYDFAIDINGNLIAS